MDFWDDWCQPCHAMAPAIENLASDFEGSAKVGKLDIEKNPTLAEHFSIHCPGAAVPELS